MGRLSKVVLLALLLVIAGVPSTAACLCAQPLGSGAPACCAAHPQGSTARCGMTSTLSGNLSCCKVAPVELTPALPTTIPVSSHDGAYQLHAIRGEVLPIPVSLLSSDTGSPHLAKKLHSPVQALLCTFLV